MGNWVLSLGSDIDLSSQSSAEVKNEWNCTSYPLLFTWVFVFSGCVVMTYIQQ
jgi:hypothetical protein